MNAKRLPNLLPIKQLCAKYPFTEPSIRWHIFCSKSRESSRGTIPGNGLARAIVRVGRRILIDEERFFDWLLEQDAASDAHGQRTRTSSPSAAAGNVSDA